MRRYELMLVIRPDVADDKSQALVDRTTRGIVSAGGQIVKVAPWGRRRLAYQIRKQREGQYVLMNLTLDPKSTGELERNIRYLETVLRHMLSVV